MAYHTRAFHPCEQASRFLDIVRERHIWRAACVLAAAGQVGRTTFGPWPLARLDLFTSASRRGDAPWTRMNVSSPDQIRPTTCATAAGTKSRASGGVPGRDGVWVEVVTPRPSVPVVVDEEVAAQGGCVDFCCLRTFLWKTRRASALISGLRQVHGPRRRPSTLRIAACGDAGALPQAFEGGLALELGLPIARL